MSCSKAGLSEEIVLPCQRHLKPLIQSLGGKLWTSSAESDAVMSFALEFKDGKQSVLRILIVLFHLVRILFETRSGYVT